MRICPVCGWAFAPDDENRVWCSPECRAVAAKKLAAASQKAHAVRTRSVASSAPKTARGRGPAGERSRTRVCPVCGKSFTPIRSGQVYCSASCRSESERARQKKPLAAVVVCAVCGRTFSPSNHSRKTCCPRCAAEYQRLAAKKRYLERKAAAPKKVLTCPVCGKRFTPSHCRQVFCSPECRDVRYAQTHNKNIKRVCPVCGKSFILSRENKVYCSRECARAGKHPPRPCVICGKLFRPEDNRTQVCSEACAEVRRRRWNVIGAARAKEARQAKRAARAAG